MPNKPRGNQYQPFSALKGFNEKLREREKVRCDKKVLSEEKLEELNRKMNNISKGDFVIIIYYNKDSYEETKGIVTSIDYVNKNIKIDTLKISFYDIYDINREL